MKRLVAFSFVLLASMALAGSMQAGDEEKLVTLEGDLVCAKCSLKEEGREQCQNVLVVKAKEEAKHYYMEKNEVSEEYGHVCMAVKPVRVTGRVSDKDGKTWLAAETIVALEEKG